LFKPLRLMPGHETMIGSITVKAKRFTLVPHTPASQGWQVTLGRLDRFLVQSIFMV
jgi:hypothetical protein